jgi:hypothetical protein
LIFHKFLVGLSFVDLLFALIVALRRYKQMAASQKNGDVCVAIARTRLHDPPHENSVGGQAQKEQINAG